jgi:hypothetical protein
MPCLSLSALQTPSMETESQDGCATRVTRGPVASVQVEAFLNRHEDGADAVVKCIVEAVEELGFRSWAYRIINTAGDKPQSDHTGRSVLMDGHKKLTF